MYFTIFKKEKKETTLVKPASSEEEIGKILLWAPSSVLETVTERS